MTRPLLVTLLLAAGCGREVELPRVDRGPGPNASTDPLGAAIHADLVARGGAMETSEPLRRGRLLDDGTAEQSIILPAGYCYAIFARAEAKAGGLAIRLVDSNGDPRQLDRETRPAADIGMTEPLCPEPTTEFRLELRGEHPADFVVQVLRVSMI